MVESDCFVKLNFSQNQLNAMSELYHRYFYPKIKDDAYMGKGFVFIWEDNLNWTMSKGLDVNHNNVGYSVHECSDDPLWSEFSDILPYMGKTAVLTKMPPNN